MLFWTDHLAGFQLMRKLSIEIGFFLKAKGEVKLFVPCGSPVPVVSTYLCCCSTFRLSMSPDEQKDFWRKVQFTVDKDVVRTDRSNQFFRGENNPNVETMR